MPQWHFRLTAVFYSFLTRSLILRRDYETNHRSSKGAICKKYSISSSVRRIKTQETHLTNESQDTEVVHFETMHSYEAKARFKDQDGYHADGEADRLEQLEFRTPSITRRQASAQSYYWEAAMDRNDKLNLLTDPTSKFPKLAGFAMGRKQDQLIIDAFGSPVNGGRSGQNIINFDIANNVVPLGVCLENGTNALAANDLEDNADAQAGEARLNTIRRGGLTVDKLLKAH